MSGVNKVIIVGRLGQDPELKYTPMGSAVCNFSVATSENWNDKNGQKQERTEWHRIVVWSKLAELCNQYLGKGRQAYIEGRLQTRSWEDQNGQKRYTTEIVANTVQFLDGRPQSGQNPQFDQSGPQDNFNQEPQGGQSVMDQNYQISNDSNFTADDIPF